MSPKGGGGGSPGWWQGTPTPEWGGGGMAGRTATAAPRLPLAPSVIGNVPRPPPPLASAGGAHNECRLSGERQGWDVQRPGATATPRLPTLTPRP